MKLPHLLLPTLLLLTLLLPTLSQKPTPSPFLDTALSTMLTPPARAGRIIVQNLGDGLIVLSLFCQNDAIRRFILDLPKIPPTSELNALANAAVQDRNDDKQKACRKGQVDEWTRVARLCLKLAEKAVRKGVKKAKGEPNRKVVSIEKRFPAGEAGDVFVTDDPRFVILNLVCGNEAVSLLLGRRGGVQLDKVERVANKAVGKGGKKVRLCERGKVGRWGKVARKCLIRGGKAVARIGM